MRILITGAGGFIGSHLCETLLAQKYKVTVNDLRDWNGMTVSTVDDEQRPTSRVVLLKKFTDDGLFSLGRVECLGACVNAPVVKINENYYEDLDSESLNKLLDNLKMKKKVKIGSQLKRKGSEPVK